jgi:protein gp37
MGSKTGISWTDATWNPWQGCTKVSDGCKNCYMYREKERYGQDPFKVVRSKPATFNAPHNWERNLKVPEGSKVFVCSWSDFFHPAADAWRGEAWQIIQDSPNFDFLIPTKRPERIAKCLPVNWHDGYHNVWLGVSAEDQETFNVRTALLDEIPAAVKWVSAEPLLGKISMSHYFLRKGLDWVVIGGESGPNCRPMNIEWAQTITHDCKFMGIKVFVKQLGGWPNTRHELADFPEDLQVREFPR